jgi:chorismate lyase / 3-hydroxybenzoate synthase
MIVEFAFGEAGDESKGTLGIALPLLGGEARVAIGGPVEPAGREGGVSLWRGSGSLVGIARLEPGHDLENATIQAYAGILRAARGLNLYRIWNCVPRINASEPGGIENYHAFCRGRSLAFEAAFGSGFARSLPAASAVGTDDSELSVAFVAGSGTPRHIENPAQVPAYEYPVEHGPRPPSFARATVVDSGATLDVFVSGTSAVVGHETVAPNDTLAQLDCTFENLRLISGACGLGDRLGSGAGCRRHFRVYLRNASDLAAVARRVEAGILSPGDGVSYLGADICRAALNVEIEVAVRGAERI